MNVNNLCLGCMNTLTNPRAACPHCGWSRRTSQNHLQQLPQGITLTNPTNGKQYLIGKTVGQGGFGIVYTAWDVAGNRKVAVKECFPSHFVTRDRSNTVVLNNDTQANRNFFDKQKRRFRQEAEKMQLFRDSNSVVNVFDFFDANNTSYIVMEFIEGQTFEQVLSRVPNQRLTLQTVLSNFQHIINILERMHHTPWTDDNGKIHQGIIHRDISPENIMYASDGTVKLLDFGTARASDPSETLTIMLKHGYASHEQYLTAGAAAMQGSWTDVYALAATIYRAITGERPPSAIDRWSNVATIKLPSAFGIQITPAQEQILLNGLALDYRNRYQSVTQFYNDLVNAGSYDNDNTKHVEISAPEENSSPQGDTETDKSTLLLALIFSAIGFLSIAIFLGLVSYGIYLVRDSIPADDFHFIWAGIVLPGVSTVCLGVYTWELWRIHNGKQPEILTNATWQNAVIGLQTLISIAALIFTIDRIYHKMAWLALTYVACSLLGIWLGRKFLCKNS